MLTYYRTVKVTGFHILEESGTWATVQYSFSIEIEGEVVRESITEEFENIGDAPHIGESVTIEVQVFEGENEYYTIERA